MSSELRRTSADDPGETATTTPVSDNQAIHGANPTMSRRMLADLPDYDGEVPPPLEGADPGNEDAGEPAETTGLGDGHHSPDELRAWLGRATGDGSAAGDSAGDGQAAPADEPGDPEGTEQARPGTRSAADAETPDTDASPPADPSRDATPDSNADEQRMQTALEGMKADYDATDKAADRAVGKDADTERIKKLENELAESQASQSKLIDALSRRDDKVEKLETENERLKTELAEARKNKPADPSGGTDKSADEISEKTDAVDPLDRNRESGLEKDGIFDEQRKRSRLPGKESVALFGGAVAAVDAIGSVTHILSSADTMVIGGVATLIGAGYLWGKKKWDNYQERRNADRQQD